MNRILLIIKKFKIALSIIFGLIFLIAFIFWLNISPLQDETFVSIENGSTLRDIAGTLKEAGAIKSKSAFSILATTKGFHNKLRSGIYKLNSYDSMSHIIERFSDGDYQVPIVRLQIPEGSTVKQIANIIGTTFNIPEAELIQEMKDKEGYLFPDTYYFYMTSTSTEIVQKLSETFENKISELKLDPEGTPLSDIIIMASIIEKEADQDSKQEVGNILWKRLEIDMPLQVDAPFVYEREKGTFDLTLDDLREDSLYNTYTRKGLPPTPISNPGLEAIKAAAFPQETPYLYFLTGNDGNMYYAETFEGHKDNKEKYIY